jgi:hypothetical protein
MELVTVNQITRIGKRLEDSAQDVYGEIYLLIRKKTSDPRERSVIQMRVLQMLSEAVLNSAVRD